MGEGLGKKRRQVTPFFQNTSPSSRFVCRETNVKFTSNRISSNFIWIVSLGGNLIWDSGRSDPNPVCAPIIRNRPSGHQSTFEVKKKRRDFLFLFNVTRRSRSDWLTVQLTDFTDVTPVIFGICNSFKFIHHLQWHLWLKTLYFKFILFLNRNLSLFLKL